jgi:hypothetical protein
VCKGPLQRVARALGILLPLQHARQHFVYTHEACTPTTMTNPHTACYAHLEQRSVVVFGQQVVQGRHHGKHSLARPVRLVRHKAPLRPQTRELRTGDGRG